MNRSNRVEVDRSDLIISPLRMCMHLCMVHNVDVSEVCVGVWVCVVESIERKILSCSWSTHAKRQPVSLVTFPAQQLHYKTQHIRTQYHYHFNIPLLDSSPTHWLKPHSCLNRHKELCSIWCDLQAMCASQWRFNQWFISAACSQAHGSHREGGAEGSGWKRRDLTNQPSS